MWNHHQTQWYPHNIYFITNFMLCATFFSCFFFFFFLLVRDFFSLHKLVYHTLFFFLCFRYETCIVEFDGSCLCHKEIKLHGFWFFFLFSWAILSLECFFKNRRKRKKKAGRLMFLWDFFFYWSPHESKYEINLRFDWFQNSVENWL